MKITTKILVPVDFSKCSENALSFAIALADKIKANIEVLYVQAIDTSNMENPVIGLTVIQEQISQSRKRLIKFVQNATENIRSTLGEHPSIQNNIEIGRIEATICNVATEKEIDYILMGTQGENSTLDKYLGSVASNVIKNAPCPVLVIPENSDFEKKLVIGYATELMDADPFEIWKTIKLFKPFQPEIKCVHFKEKQDNKEDKIKEMEHYFSETAPEINIEFYSLSVKDKVNDMNDFIIEHNVDILVMYKPNRTYFDSMFHKSYTQKMAKHTKIPLLVIKEGK